MNKERLFTASCIALIATAMSFAIRGDIMGDFETTLPPEQDQRRLDLGRGVLGLRPVDLHRRPALRPARHGHHHAARRGRPHRRHAADAGRAELRGAVPGDGHHRHRQRPRRGGRQPAHRDDLRREQDGQAHRPPRLVPGGIVIGGVLAFLFTQIGLGLAGEDAAAARAVGRSTPFLFVGPEVPGDRARSRRRAVRRHVQGARPGRCSS